MAEEKQTSTGIEQFQAVPKAREMRIADIPGELPVLPISNNVIFPSTITPVAIGKPISLAAVEILLNSGKRSSRPAKATRKGAKEERQVMYRVWYNCMKNARCPASDATIRKAGELMATTLSGYAIRRAVRPDDGLSLEPQLAFLVRTLTAVLNEG